MKRPVRRVLVIAAHPDDEVLGCGGTLALHARAGDEVHAAIACEGESLRYGPEGVGQSHHMQQAAQTLGLQDVRLLYESPDMDAVWPILSRYRVAYIYVGGLERAYYPAEGLAKFEHAVGTGLARVYQAQGVTIFRVERPEQP